ncbi:general transcription factor IIH subunit 3 isoform X1 [Podarcis lilfordi]|uniref:General transcription factor IIH subunit 3 n=1 Tax=Podarcis lilfordi TaxID=74358 RepID=A0AA35PUD3_9SAUR|nr:general transcription factor IIH subunit 3 isoform X1 [Podarcis lilfordi]
MVPCTFCRSLRDSNKQIGHKTLNFNPPTELGNCQLMFSQFWGLMFHYFFPDDELNLLVIVVDTNPIWWGKQALGGSELTLSKCLDAAMVLGNSHLFMNRNNKLAVIASHIQESRFLYPGKHWAPADLFGESNISGSKDGKYELLTTINETIAEEIKDLMTNTEIRGQQTESLLAGSLAKAICYIHRMTKEGKASQEIKSRILVIKAAEDSALQYMNFMNVIFAAQKQNILIDACVLDSDSGLLQQACDITGGIYLKVPHMPSLLQYLLVSSTFLITSIFILVQKCSMKKLV